ncbi:MAG: tetratricopeptide repeat protein, partial [Lysobacteraceae bacterium]
NQPELAEANLREALRVAPASTRAAARLAKMLVARGRSDEASTVLRDMARSAQISPRAQAVLASFHLSNDPLQR